MFGSGEGGCLGAGLRGDGRMFGSGEMGKCLGAGEGHIFFGCWRTGTHDPLRDFGVC